MNPVILHANSIKASLRSHCVKLKEFVVTTISTRGNPLNKDVATIKLFSSGVVGNICAGLFHQSWLNKIFSTRRLTRLILALTGRWFLSCAITTCQCTHARAHAATAKADIHTKVMYTDTSMYTPFMHYTVPVTNYTHFGGGNKNSNVE